MPDKVPVLDENVSADQIQAIRSDDGLAAFLAGLHYNTNARVTQTPSALGLATGPVAREVKKIQRLARQEGADPLEIYLFELKSIIMIYMKMSCWEEKMADILF